MKTGDKTLTVLLEPTVRAMGLELWGIEHLRHGRRSLLRIYIDSENGVGIDDCERVSRQVSGILDVEDPIVGEYTLEVSSPGSERRLFTQAQYGMYVGSMVSIKLQALRDGRRNFKGRIQQVAEKDLIIDQDGTTVSLPFSEIEKGHIVSIDDAG